MLGVATGVVSQVQTLNGGFVNEATECQSRCQGRPLVDELWRLCCSTYRDLRVYMKLVIFSRETNQLGGAAMYRYSHLLLLVV